MVALKMGRRQGVARRLRIDSDMRPPHALSPAHFQRNPPATAGWLFFRVARSLHINLDMLVARALKNSQLTCDHMPAIHDTMH